MDSLRNSLRQSLQRQRQKWAWLFTVGRISAGMFLWPVLATIAIVISAILHLQTDLANRIAAERVSTLVSDLIKGELRISRFDSLTLDSALARHVSFYDEAGRRVVSAGTVRLTLDLPALLYGTLHIPTAELDGGTVRLIEGQSGLPTLIEGFLPVDDEPALPGMEGPTLNAAIDDMRLRNVTAYGELLGLQGIRAIHVTADADLFATPDIEVNIKRANGTLVAPFAFEGAIEDLAGSISTVPQRGVQLHVKASRDDEQATASVTYATPIGKTESELDLQVHADPIRTQTLRDVGYAWAEPLSSMIYGDFRLRGPTDNLVMSAQLRTDGGPIAIEGLIHTERGVSISVTGRDIALQKVVPNAPQLRVSGLGRIDVLPNQAEPVVHLEVEPLAYEQIAVPAFELDGKLVDDGVQIDHVRATHVPGALSGRGHLSWTGELRGHVSAYFPNVARDANIRRFVPDAHGSLRADLDLKFDPDRAHYIDFSGRVVLTDVTYGPLSAKRLELSGYARGDQHLPRVSLRAKGEAVRAEGYLLGNADLTVKGAPPEYLASGEFQREGQRTFHLDAKVQADHERVILNAEQIELAVGDETWRGAIKELVLREGESVAVEMFRLASRSQRLEASGIVRFDGDDEINAQLQGFDVAAIRALLGKNAYLQAGFLDANVELRGDIRRPKLLVQGAVTAATIRAFENVNGLYFVTYEDGALQVDSELSLEQAGTWTLSGSGVLDTNLTNPIAALRSGRYDLTLAAQEADLLALASLADATVPIETGTLVSATFHGTGTWQQPTLEADLQLANVLAPGTRPVSGTLHVNYDARNASINAHVLDLGGEVLAVTASAPMDWQALLQDPQGLVATLGQSRWQLEAELSERALSQLPIALGESLNLPITLSGHVSANRLHGRPLADITVRGGWFGELPPSSCNEAPRPRGLLTAVLSGDVAAVRVDAGFDGAPVLSAQQTFRWTWAQWLDGGDLPLPGEMNGFVRVDMGALERVPYVCDQASGKLLMTAQVQRLWSDDPHVDVRINGQAQLTAERQRRRRNVIVPSCPNNPLTIKGEGSMDRQWARAGLHVEGCGTTALDINAKGPLAWIAHGLVPSWDPDRPVDVSAIFDDVQLKPLLDRLPGVFSAEAVADGRLNVSGTSSRPQFGGTLELREGALRLVSTGQNISSVAGRAVMHSNWIELQELHGSDERGRVQMSGGIGFDAWTLRRIRLALSAEQFPIRHEGVEKASVSAEALLQATLNDEQIGMDLAFHSLAVRLPDDVGRTLQPLDEHPDIEVVGRRRPKPDADARPIGIHVHSARPFWVRRSDFSALVDSNLNIVYADPDVAIGGYVELNRGVFDVFGKTFNLERGSIRFDGSTDINPELNLIAVHDPNTAGSSPVRVVVTGRMSAPEVQFSAQGCDDEGGALRLLLTGSCKVSDTAGPSEGADSQRAAFVGGLLAGVLTLGAKRELGALVPVLGIESTGQGFNQRIRAGIDADTLVPKFMRPIVRRAYVEGAVTTGSENTDGTTGPASVDFLLELYFPHNIVGSGRVTPGSTQVQWGVDVIWEP